MTTTTTTTAQKTCPKMRHVSQMTTRDRRELAGRLADAERNYRSAQLALDHTPGEASHARMAVARQEAEAASSVARMVLNMAGPPWPQL